MSQAGLAVLGFVTVLLFLALIVTRRVSVTVALILVPALTATAGGFAGTLGPMVMTGLGSVAPVGIMMMFAILYFGLMIEVGLFDPLVAALHRLVKGDPLRVVLGTAALTTAVALDGDGATTFMITISTMLPVYERLGMNRLVLSGTVCLAAGVMNILPWGGPTARAMATLKASSQAIFVPVVPAMLAGLAWVFFVAWIFGRRERARLGIRPELSTSAVGLPPEEARLRRASLFWFNALVTAALLAALLASALPLALLFMLAYALVLPVNFPAPKDQMERIAAQGRTIVFVCSMIFAAGVFTGVLTGTKMIGAMAAALVGLIPDALAGYLPTIVAITSMPLSLAFPPDAYYFGVLPILAQTAAGIGLDPVTVGRAAILGQMTTGFPLSPLTASTFILVGMSGVELGDHQRFIFGWAFGSTVVMTLVAILTGALPLS